MNCDGSYTMYLPLRPYRARCELTRERLLSINQKIQTFLYGRQDVTRYIYIKIFAKQEVMNGR